MNSPQLIPIENIYYLFCYAWNRFEEAQTIPLGASPGPDLPNLLARVCVADLAQSSGAGSSVRTSHLKMKLRLFEAELTSGLASA